jgi:hypothetical protein
MTTLHQAAQDVLTRWDSPSWNEIGDTATYIQALRTALAQEIEDEADAMTLVYMSGLEAGKLAAKQNEPTKATILTPTEKFLLHEMRYIAGIGRGPVARVAEHAMTIAQKMHANGSFTGEGTKP